jgi:hypothetical protein
MLLIGNGQLLILYTARIRDDGVLFFISLEMLLISSHKELSFDNSNNEDKPFISTPLLSD